MVEQNDYASCDECGWFYSVESSWSKQTPVCGECDARLISGIKPLPPKKYLPYLFQTQPCDGGATAVVYEGTNLNTRQPVMGKRFSANTISAVGPDELVAQAEASADFGVSGVVSTYDIRESEREVVLVLPKIQGRQLGNIRLNPDFKCEEALDLILPVLQILAALHRLGVLHNDVKPSNAIVGRQGTTLIDLCSTGRVYACPRVYSLTPGFASPQLALRQWDELCPSSDVYSVGKMFLALVLGPLVIKTIRPPQFSGQSEAEYLDELTKERAEQLEALERAGADEDVCSMIEEWTELEPSLRPPTALEAQARAAAVRVRLACLRSGGYAKGVGRS